jgi:hypothetical protein
VAITTFWNFVFFISQHNLPAFYPVNGHFLVKRVVKVRIVFVKEFADHHHFAVFQFDHRLQRHAFVVALADIADQAVGVAAVVDLIDAQIFRAQQNVQPLAPLDGKLT